MDTLKGIHLKTPTRRKAIIEAALHCFTESSISETNMSDIIKRSGSSVGSVYHHFKSKEKLAASVYMDGIIDYQNGLTLALNSEIDAYSGII